MYGRSMAHIEQIVKTYPIDGADNVEMAQVLDYHVVVKKGEFAPNDMVVYIDDMGTLKAFNQGITNTLLSHRPEYYEVKDQVMIFIDQGYFKTYCNGTIQIIERYIPTKYVLDWNSISYIDDNQNVKVVQNCEKHVVTYELVTDIEMIRNLIVYKTGPNATRIYYFGQVFEK